MSIAWPAGTAAALLHMLLMGERPECALILAELTIDGDAPIGRAAAQLVCCVDGLLRRSQAPSATQWHELYGYRPASLSRTEWRPLVAAASALDAALRAHGPPESLDDAPSAVRLFHTVASTDQKYFERTVAPLLAIDDATSSSSSLAAVDDAASLSSPTTLSSLQALSALGSSSVQSE